MQEGRMFFGNKKEQYSQKQEHDEDDWLSGNLEEEERKDLEYLLETKTLEEVISRAETFNHITPTEIFSTITTNENAQEIAVHLYNADTRGRVKPETLGAFWKAAAKTIERDPLFAWIFMAVYFDRYQNQSWIEEVVKKAIQHFDVAKDFIRKSQEDYRTEEQKNQPWADDAKQKAVETILYGIYMNQDHAIEFAQYLDVYSEYCTEEQLQQCAEVIVRCPFAAHEFGKIVNDQKEEVWDEDLEYVQQNIQPPSNEWKNSPWVDEMAKEAEKTVKEYEEKIKNSSAIAMVIMKRAKEYNNRDWRSIVPQFIKKAVQHYSAAEVFIEESNKKDCVWKNDAWAQECLKEAKTLRQKIAQEARERRDDLLEKENLFTLSEEEFEKYFGSEEIQQTDTGNCYVVAAMYGIRRWPHFKIAARKSMKRNSDGTWEVQLPLMSGAAEKVTITQQEIQPQENKNFFYGKHPSRDSVDARVTLDPINGPEGYQVIEAAYLKKQFGAVDRAKSDHGGRPENVLKIFGGNMFITSHIMKEGKADTERFTGFFENFDPEIYMATCFAYEEGEHSTRKRVGEAIIAEESKNIARIQEAEIRTQHEYTIIGVDTERKMVEIVNPHDTKETIILTFEQFEQSFDCIAAIRINNESLLESLKSAEKTDTIQV